jgi:transposase
MNTTPPFPPELWEQTPIAVREYIRTLEARVAALEATVQQLLERLQQDSHNSSRPPSSDPPHALRPRPRRGSSGRKRGGQPGHRGQTRTLMPIEDVDTVVPVKPQHCHRCHHPLQGDDPQPYRHQVTELPPIKPVVTEYQLHRLLCPACGMPTRADLPRGVPPGGFGPRVQAIVALCTGAYRLSKRTTQEVMADLFGLPMSLGTIPHLEQATVQAVAEPVAEAHTYIRTQPVAHLDETGWREGRTRAWLWVAVTAGVTVFVVRLSRGAKVAQALLGERFCGILVTDRWSAYTWYPTRWRQVCWAHLLRDFEAMIERGGRSQEVGEGLREQTWQMFHAWHRVRDGSLTHAQFRVAMRPIRRAVARLLKAGQTCGVAKTEGVCREVLKVYDALWTFVRVEGVEPTNNAAERAIRPGVLWRKGSFGTQSAQGSQFVEAMMTMVATLKQQHRNVLAYLTDACQAAYSGMPAPSLLPPHTIAAADLPIVA